MWKFSVDHTYNTFTADYDGGWTKDRAATCPARARTSRPTAPPTLVFKMFPSVYNIPFHYANPVTGRTELPPIKRRHTRMRRLRRREPSGEGHAARHRGRAARDRPEDRRPQRPSELYAPLQPKEPYQNVTLTRDISYGPHERHVLDLFVAAGHDGEERASRSSCSFTAAGSPRGAKHAPELAVLRQRRAVGRVARVRRRHDQLSARAAVSVSRGCRGSRRASSLGCKANIKAIGRRPEEDLPVGPFRWRRSYRRLPRRMRRTSARSPAIAGAILTSGFYELGDTVSVWKAYYGEDVSKYKERSSLPGS